MSVTAGNGAITLSHLPRYSYTMRAVPFRILNTGFFVGLARQRVLLWSRRYRRTSANVMLNPASGSGLPMARMRKYGRQQSTEFTPLQKSPRQGPAKQSNCTPKRLVIWPWAFASPYFHTSGSSAEHGITHQSSYPMTVPTCATPLLKAHSRAWIDPV